MVLHQEIGKAFGTVPAGKGDGHEAMAVSGKQKEVPQAPRSDTGHRLALLPARS